MWGDSEWEGSPRRYGSVELLHSQERGLMQRIAVGLGNPGERVQSANHERLVPMWRSRLGHSSCRGGRRRGSRDLPRVWNTGKDQKRRQAKRGAVFQDMSRNVSSWPTTVSR